MSALPPEVYYATVIGDQESPKVYSNEVALPMLALQLDASG